MMNKRILWMLTAFNAVAALITVASLSYLVGFRDAQRGGESNWKRQASRTIVPNPSVGKGQHPAIDCSRLRKPMAPPRDGVSDLEALSLQRRKLEGQPVAVRGIVVQAYREIMGVNWFHLCDRPSGDVLVVSAQAWVEPGNEIEVRGHLSLDRNIGNAYVFPLFIENGVLEGEKVEEARSGMSNPIQYL